MPEDAIPERGGRDELRSSGELSFVSELVNSTNSTDGDGDVQLNPNIIRTAIVTVAGCKGTHNYNTSTYLDPCIEFPLCLDLKSFLL